MSVSVLVSVLLLLCFVKIIVAEDNYQSPGSLFEAPKPIIFHKRGSEKIQTRQRRQGYVRSPDSFNRNVYHQVPQNAQSQFLGRSQQPLLPPAPGPFPLSPPNSAPFHPKLYPRRPLFITQPVQQRQFNMKTRPLNWPGYKASNVQNNTGSRTYVGDANKAGVIGGVPPDGAQRPAPPPESEAHPYYFPPRMQLPLPSCFHNPTGYACCNAQLNDLMVETYTELEAKPKFHICNINAIANQIQKKAEEKFNTTFETIASFEDFAQKIHFHTDLVCKVELGGKFMLAYGTVKNVADKLPPATEPANVVKREVFGPEPEPEIPPHPIYHSILI